MDYKISPIIKKELVFTERSGIGENGKKCLKGTNDLIYFLKGYFENKTNTTAIEIGSYAGELSILLATIFTQVNCVDPWLNYYDDKDYSSEAIPMHIVFDSFRFRTKNIDNIIINEMTSKQKFDSINIDNLTSPDFVYLDSIHNYKNVVEDITMWSSIISPGGILAGHDFCGYWGEVVDAILNTIGLPDQVFDDGSWIKYM